MPGGTAAASEPAHERLWLRLPATIGELAQGRRIGAFHRFFESGSGMFATRSAVLR